MAIEQIFISTGWAYANNTATSFSFTLNLPTQTPAVAQVVLTRSAYFDTPGYAQVYFTAFSANGAPFPVFDGAVVLGVDNADSFSWEGDVAQGAMTASLTVYCFE
jgi:hypothetical protein